MKQRIYIDTSVICCLFVLFFAVNPAFAKSDTTPDPKYKLGVLPVVSFDADMGVQYGGMLNLYDHRGGIYPDFRQMSKIEISRYTKGSGANQLFYDAKHILPHNLRITADFSYLTEQKLDFFGFNGYLSRYNPAFVEQGNADYRTRVFYSHERKFLKFNADLQGDLFLPHLRWLAGFGIVNTKVRATDVAKLNRGESEADKLPEGALTLFDCYRNLGLISDAEADGGWTNFLKAGVVYDTRDNEYAPTRGLWSEALLFYVPKFLFNPEFEYLKLVLTHRQYFPLIHNRLTLAVRVGYQGTIGGRTPFFMQPYMISSISSINKSDGLGGAKTLRGVMRNRVVGDGIVQGIAELRWKVVTFTLFKQNISLTLDGFFDGGQVVQMIDIPKDVLNNYSEFFDASMRFDRPHCALGAGLRIAINHNFIVSLDYGFALNRQDGTRGLYINVGNLF